MPTATSTPLAKSIARRAQALDDAAIAREEKVRPVPYTRLLALANEALAAGAVNTKDLDETAWFLVRFVWSPIELAWRDPRASDDPTIYRGRRPDEHELVYELAVALADQGVRSDRDMPPSFYAWAWRQAAPLLDDYAYESLGIHEELRQLQGEACTTRDLRLPRRTGVDARELVPVPASGRWVTSASDEPAGVDSGAGCWARSNGRLLERVQRTPRAVDPRRRGARLRHRARR